MSVFAPAEPMWSLAFLFVVRFDGRMKLAPDRFTRDSDVLHVLLGLVLATFCSFDRRELTRFPFLCLTVSMP